MKSVCLKQAFDYEGHCSCGRCQYEARLKRKYPQVHRRHGGPKCDCRVCMADRARKKHARRQDGKKRRRNRPKVAKTDRAFIFERDGYRCVRCGSPENITIDHIIPLARGGANKRDNYQTLCGPCNQEKGSCMKDESQEASA